MDGEFEYTRVREIRKDTPFYVSKLTRAILRMTPMAKNFRSHLIEKNLLKPVHLMNLTDPRSMDNTIDKWQ